jgi:hypothetical protein
VRAAKTYHEELVDAIDDWLIETDPAYVAEDPAAPAFGG